MKIFVDENIPLITIEKLLKIGHDVLDIRGTEKEGVDDENVWKIALNEKRMLITTDKGFANYRDNNPNGILMVCLKKPNRLRIHERILYALSHFAENEWPGLMVTVKDTVQVVWKSDELEFIQ
ncbi:MAG: hypothetical protein GY757_49635 [bacterium]|nr:hypothetical protein [bacterium]